MRGVAGDVACEGVVQRRAALDAHVLWRIGHSGTGCVVHRSRGRNCRCGCQEKRGRDLSAKDVPNDRLYSCALVGWTGMW